jgi:hypothetical protein
VPVEKAKDGQRLEESNAPLVRAETQVSGEVVGGDKRSSLRLAEGERLHDMLEKPSEGDRESRDGSESSSTDGVVKDKEGETVKVSSSLYRKLTGRSG